MEFWFLIFGALIAFISMIFHGVVGGKIYWDNISKSNLQPLTQSLSLVSWHVFTIFLFACAITLLLIAFQPGLAVAAYPIILANALGAMLFLVLGLGGKHRILLKMPGCYLMAATALFAWLGIG